MPELSKYTKAERREQAIHRFQQLCINWSTGNTKQQCKDLYLANKKEDRQATCFNFRQNWKQLLKKYLYLEGDELQDRIDEHKLRLSTRQQKADALDMFGAATTAQKLVMELEGCYNNKLDVTVKPDNDFLITIEGVDLPEKSTD